MKQRSVHLLTRIVSISISITIVVSQCGPLALSATVQSNSDATTPALAGLSAQRIEGIGTVGIALNPLEGILSERSVLTNPSPITLKPSDNIVLDSALLGSRRGQAPDIVVSGDQDIPDPEPDNIRHTVKITDRSRQSGKLLGSGEKNISNRMTEAVAMPEELAGRAGTFFDRSTVGRRTPSASMNYALGVGFMGDEVHRGQRHITNNETSSLAISAKDSDKLSKTAAERAPLLNQLEGRLDASSYRFPAKSQFKIAALQAGVITFGALFPATLISEITWLGAAVVGLIVWKAYVVSNSHDPPPYTTSRLTKEDTRAFQQSIQKILRLLVLRIGSPEDRMPRLYIYAATNAQAYGKRVDANSNIGIGDRLKNDSPEQIAGTMAHELGHLHFEDSNIFPLISKAALLGLAIALTSLNVPGLQTLLLCCGIPGFLISFFLYLGASQQQELRADDFAAWLTDPRWQLDEFHRLKLETDAQFSKRKLSRLGIMLAWLLSKHPSYDARIRQLERLIRR